MPNAFANPVLLCYIYISSSGISMPYKVCSVEYGMLWPRPPSTIVLRVLIPPCKPVRCRVFECGTWKRSSLEFSNSNSTVPVIFPCVIFPVMTPWVERFDVFPRLHLTKRTRKDGSVTATVLTESSATDQVWIMRDVSWELLAEIRAFWATTIRAIAAAIDVKPTTKTNVKRIIPSFWFADLVGLKAGQQALFG